jgi:hypothetical protein
LRIEVSGGSLQFSVVSLELSVWSFQFSVFSLEFSVGGFSLEVSGRGAMEGGLRGLREVRTGRM